YLLREAGSPDGSIDYMTMSALAPYGSIRLGLGENYMVLEDITTDKEWVFGGEKGAIEHSIFTSMHTQVIPVVDKDETVMEKGTDYILHSYRIDENNIALDIYTSQICSFSPTTPDETKRYRDIACDEISALGKNLMGKKDIQDQVVGPVANGAAEHVTAWVVPSVRMEAGDMTPRRMRLSDNWECDDDGNVNLCVRFFGDYNIPLKLSIDMERKAEFVRHLEYGQGAGPSGAGARGEW
ncbi:MAG: hypothetical protein KAT35_02515, partial [Candidatus Aenigmarchaeota archaeon]|nr:hypothetical protein [Candidatus Aenigmarchaeota archaeon]